MSYLLVVIAIIGGTLITYLYDEEEGFLTRLCMGATIGLIAFGLIGLLLASLFGLSIGVVLFTALIVALPFLLLKDPRRQLQLKIDIKDAFLNILNGIYRPTKQTIGYIVFFLLLGIMMWHIYDRAMYVRNGGIYTGIDHNLGDLPLHIGIITGFVYGENFPPEHPEFSGARLTYPFLSDFITSIFVKAGSAMSDAMFLQNIVFAIALIGLLYYWAKKLTRDNIAALITPILFLLNGGIGWIMLFEQSNGNEKGLLELLMNLPRYYSITGESGTYRFGNILTTMLVPQRSLLIGVPLFLIVWTIWWQVVSEPVNKNEEPVITKPEEEIKKKGKRRKKEKHVTRPRIITSPQSIAFRRMIAAGILAGMMPLAHAHSFAVLMGMALCLSLIFWRWREWGLFFLVASLIALPQLLWVTHGSEMHSDRFVGWHLGWDKGETGFLWFWFKNTGLFVPLAIVAIAWWWRERIAPVKLILFLLPFLLCFIVPNLIKLAPWPWDNIKVLIYWYLAFAPLVALVLAKLWRLNIPLKILSLVMLLTMILSGSLDAWRTVTKATEQQIYDANSNLFAEFVREKTPPRSLFINRPTYNNVVLLTGRRSLMGYDGHLWSHGFDYYERKADVENIYAGAFNADELLKKHKVEYVVVGPMERSMPGFDESFFNRYTKVGGSSGHSLYKVSQSEDQKK
jgi:hypothetical protein